MFSGLMSAKSENFVWWQQLAFCKFCSKTGSFTIIFYCKTVKFGGDHALLILGLFFHWFLHVWLVTEKQTQQESVYGKIAMETKHGHWALLTNWSNVKSLWHILTIGLTGTPVLESGLHPTSPFSWFCIHQSSDRLDILDAVLVFNLRPFNHSNVHVAPSTWHICIPRRD